MSKNKNGLLINGWVMFNKPVGMGSSKAVNFVQHIFNAKKAGHGGTLDPLASGILPIALGEATKTMQFILSKDKYYQFTVKFGAQTSTDDLEGEVIKSSDSLPTKSDLLKAMNSFTGEIEQVPPQFSAVKIKGQPAYKSARKGNSVTIKPRTVTVFELELLGFSGSDEAIVDATLMAHVSKGTYIRSLARDMGQKLGCFGHVTELIRTKLLNYELKDTITKEMLDSCEELGQDAKTFLLGVDALLDDIPVYKATPAEEAQLKRGIKLQRVHLNEGLMRVRSRDDRLVSIINIDADGWIKVIRNFNI